MSSSLHGTSSPYKNKVEGEAVGWRSPGLLEKKNMTDRLNDMNFGKFTLILGHHKKETNRHFETVVFSPLLSSNTYLLL